MPVTGYDAQAIEKYYDLRPLQVGWRLNSIGFPLLGEFFYSCFVYLHQSETHTVSAIMFCIYPGWYFGLLLDKTMGVSDDPTVQHKRGQELRMHLVRSKSVALIKVRNDDVSVV
jgi:hypothetical protein